MPGKHFRTYFLTTIGATAPAIAPSILDHSVVPKSTAASTQNVDISTLNWSSGDYLLSVIGTTASIVVSAVAGATDDTYAQIDSALQSGARLYAHEGTVVSAALDASVNYTLDASRRVVAGVLSIQNAASNPSQPDVSNDATGTSDTPTAPDATTTIDQCLALSIFAAQGGHTLADIVTPSGWTLLDKWATAEGVPTNSVHTTLGIAHKVVGSAGPIGSSQWSGLGASRAWVALTIAIGPA